MGTQPRERPGEAALPKPRAFAAALPVNLTFNRSFSAGRSLGPRLRLQRLRLPPKEQLQGFSPHVLSVSAPTSLRASRRASFRLVLRLVCLNFHASLVVLATLQAR